MLTTDKFKIYLKFAGDGDAFTRSAHKYAGKISDQDFAEFDDLIQDLVLQQRGLISQDYALRLKKKLDQNTKGLVENATFWKYVKKKVGLATSHNTRAAVRGARVLKLR